jgi:hypothetical protein
MIRSVLVLLLLLFTLGCAREEPVATTIEPATPPPSSPAPLGDLGKEPMITTTGSVPPQSSAERQFHDVRITSAGITARSSVPRVHTVLRLINETGEPHSIEVRAEGKTLAGPERVEPRGELLIQVRLTRERYEIVCTTHPREAPGVIETFQPQS